MFFNRNYIPAVPIREEQRLSEEEELARQLKREARIFFPDRKLPDFDTPDLPTLPKEQQGTDPKSSSGLPPEQKSQPPAREWGMQRTEPRDTVPDGEEHTVVLKDHDKVCREEDSMWRKPNGTFSHHEVEAAREEAEQIRSLASGDKVLVNGKTWAATNYKGFKYAGSEEDGKIKSLEGKAKMDYFLSRESLSSAKTDRTLLYQYMMMSAMSGTNPLELTDECRAKAEELCRAVRTVFNTDKWPDKTSWEKVLD